MTTPGLEISASAQLCASLDGLTAAMRREQDWRARQMTVIRQVPFQGSINISGGVGALDLPDMFKAKAGFVWDIKRLTIQGFSAGVVTVYRNGPVSAANGLSPGEPMCPYPVPAVNTFAKTSQMLQPEDRMTFGAVGITLASGYSAIPIWGVANVMESWYFPYYAG